MASTTQNHINKELAEEVNAEITSYIEGFAVRAEEEKVRKEEQRKQQERPSRSANLFRRFATWARR